MAASVKKLASLFDLRAKAGKAKVALRQMSRVERIRHEAPRILFGGGCLALIWLAYSMVWPIRLPEPDANQAKAADAPVILPRDLNAFADAEPVIKSRVLFIPPSPMAVGGVSGPAIEELLKKMQLAGIANLRGQPAAVIRLSGKSGLYKVGDPVGSFTLQEVSSDKVVLALNGQTVELAR
jgi:hypothetical protein